MHKYLLLACLTLFGALPSVFAAVGELDFNDDGEVNVLVIGSTHSYSEYSSSGISRSQNKFESQVVVSESAIVF